MRAVYSVTSASVIAAASARRLRTTCAPSAARPGRRAGVGIGVGVFVGVGLDTWGGVTRRRGLVRLAPTVINKSGNSRISSFTSIAGTE